MGGGRGNKGSKTQLHTRMYTHVVLEQSRIHHVQTTQCYHILYVCTLTSSELQVQSTYSTWDLVYPTTSVSCKLCQTNQVLDKSGQIVHNLVMGIHSRVSEKCFLDKLVSDKQRETVYSICIYTNLKLRLVRLQELKFVGDSSV